MRSVLLSLFGYVALAGCGFSSGIDDLQVQAPSLETTSSITRPKEPVSPAAAGPANSEEPLPSTTEAVTEPAAKPLALAELPKPTFRAEPSVADKIHEHRFRDAKPVNFGSASPKHLPVHGVDVSRWQGEIDWAKLRTQGANFAYIKATDGGDHLDPMFKRNWRAAADAGLKRGAYHFFYWCRTAGEQADWFIRNVPKVENALPPVIDVEWNGHSRNCKKRLSRKRVLEKMQVFMAKLEQHYGQRPIIYTAPDFYEDNLIGQFPDHPFWLRSVAARPAKVYPGRQWVFWQYSGSGLSHGVKGHIDLNVFNGNEEAWQIWLSKHSG